MPEEIQQTEKPATRFIKRLAETGRAKLPLLGDIKVFDKSFWKEPRIWKVPGIDAYVPTWSVVSVAVFSASSLTIGGVAFSEPVKTALELFNQFETISMERFTSQAFKSAKLAILSGLSGLFMGVTIVDILTTLKYFGVSQKILDQGPLSLTNLKNIRIRRR